MSQGPVLCLDAGRSGCRARLHPLAGDAIEAHGPPVPAVTAGGVAAVLAALEEVVAALPVSRAHVVVAGIAGIGGEGGDGGRSGIGGRRGIGGIGGASGAGEHASALAAGLAERTGAGRVVVTGDLVTGYVGALGREPGVVVSAGTGAVAFALGPRGRTARADGWGHLLGDEGGGFWIGRAGLAAALAHHDGRGGSAALAARAQAAFGPVDELPDRVYGAATGVATVAAFAPEVAAAARDGDPVAAALWEQAGRHLAAAAAAAAERVLAGRAAPVSWTGGLFAAGDLLLAPVLAELERRAPTLQPRPPAGSALDGAHRLAGLDPLPPWLPAGVAHRDSSR